MKRKIIPCLDIKDGRLVKGINFVGIKELGDPVERAIAYDKQGADELVLLDIASTSESKLVILDLVKKISKSVSAPLSVGGGIASLEYAKKVLEAGASKFSLSSALVKDRDLLAKCKDEFGSEKIIAAIDSKKRGDGTGWNVVISGGREDTGIDLVDWIKEVSTQGAGEILLTSMDADGRKEGYDIEMLRAVRKSTELPITASGGCGKLEDFGQVFKEGVADSALGASVFHYGTLTVKEVKVYLEGLML